MTRRTLGLGIILGLLWCGTSQAEVWVSAGGSQRPDVSGGCGLPCTVTVVSLSADSSRGGPGCLRIGTPFPDCWPKKEEWDFDYRHPDFDADAVGREVTWVIRKPGSSHFALRATGWDGTVKTAVVSGAFVVAPPQASDIRSKLRRQRSRRRDLLVSTLAYSVTEYGWVSNTLVLQRKLRGRWRTYRTARAKSADAYPSQASQQWVTKLGLRRGRMKMLRLQKRGAKFRAVARHLVRSGSESGKVAYRKTIIRSVRIR